MQQSASLLESAQLARRGWKAGQRANIDALTMQANYVLVRTWPTRAAPRGDVDGSGGGNDGGGDGDGGGEPMRWWLCAADDNTAGIHWRIR